MANTEEYGTVPKRSHPGESTFSPSFFCLRPFEIMTRASTAKKATLHAVEKVLSQPVRIVIAARVVATNPCDCWKDEADEGAVRRDGRRRRPAWVENRWLPIRVTNEKDGADQGRSGSGDGTA